MDSTLLQLLRMQPIPSNITKTYPQRGPLQQYRFAESLSFVCFRCGDTKKSKLITLYDKDWSKRLCNGCYGRLLSLYEIKAGTDSDDQKVEELTAQLLAMVSADDQRRSEEILRAADNRAVLLSHESVRFISTSEHVARQLQGSPYLEWSPAVIGLCKAVETEIVSRILRPLAARASSVDLSIDKNDKDIGRITAFCADPNRKPPELGSFTHFLQTVIHSRQRRDTSVLINCFLKQITEWTGSNWLLDSQGLCSVLENLTTNFRNRAAHIDELNKTDYIGCRDLVIGNQGILWQLVIASKNHS